ncbi:MAG: class I SAM-dependent methyltransferase [Dehalococcoidia bacterium]
MLPITVREMLAGHFPPRYDVWYSEFEDRVQAALKPGVQVLDVGSGRRPSLSVERRPPGCLYAGLDLSAIELQQAPSGSYDEVHVGDVVKYIPEFDNRFDLIVSWQVLEHVKPLDVALENLRRYLRPGGQLVAQMSGTFSLFGVINRLVPQRLGLWAMKHLLDRDPETVFPAYYDRCWYAALDRTLLLWTEREIISRYNAAGYFGFWRPLQAAYIVYEDWTYRNNHRNLATHYLIRTVR